MSTFELLSHFQSLGIECVADGERLRVNAPRGALTPVLRAKLVKHKLEIIEFLRRADQVATTTLSPILSMPRNGKLPLSFGQERIWHLSQLRPGSSAYNLPVVARLVGPLDMTALEDSVAEIVQRHQVLRTTIQVVDGQPVQRIIPSTTWRLSVVDLQDLPQSERDREALQQITTEVQRPFDLEQETLLRVKLWRLGADEHVFVVTMHHIISDAWSYDVFFRELAALYESFCSGQPLTLDELPIQYADFAAWQRQWLQDKVLATRLSYWQQQLAGHVPALQLPTVHPQPSTQTFQSARQTVELSPELTEALKSLSREENVTLSITLLAAFKVLLHQYTGQEDIIVCSPIVGRNRVECEGLIGYFNNIVVVRTDLSGDPSFRELLRQERQVVLGASDHQDLPFQQVANLPNLTRTPLARALFGLQDYPGRCLELSGITIKPLDVDNGMADFDLSLTMEEKLGGLLGVFKYRTDLFSADVIAQMLRNFEALLENIVSDPAQRLLTLPSFNGADGHAMLASAPTAQKLEQTFVAPRTGLELQLTKIWEQVFGIRPIGVRDNFFDLGGHSLLAVRLLEEIGQMLNRELPPHILLHAPTVVQLANILRAEGWSVPDSVLVTIQSGGSRRPFFCVSSSFLDVLGFAVLARRLGPDQPFYVLQSKGLDPHIQLGDLVTRYIETIRAVQPQGPYILGGRCYGSHISLAMAEELEAQGHKVALVALLGPGYPRGKHPRRHNLNRLIYHLRRRPSYVWHFLLRRTKNRTKRKLRFAFDSESERAIANLQRDIHARVLKSHVQQSYSGWIVSIENTKETLASWTKITTGRTDFYFIPGLHAAMFQEPDVQLMANWLKIHFDEVER